MLECRLIYPEKIKIYKNLKSITLPSILGEMEVLIDHAQSFVLLKRGTIVLTTVGDRKIKIPVKEGGVYIKDNKVKIIF